MKKKFSIRIFLISISVFFLILLLNIFAERDLEETNIVFVVNNTNIVRVVAEERFEGHSAPWIKIIRDTASFSDIGIARDLGLIKPGFDLRICSGGNAAICVEKNDEIFKVHSVYINDGVELTRYTVNEENESSWKTMVIRRYLPNEIEDLPDNVKKVAFQRGIYY